MIKCPNCSAELKFYVGEQQIKCEYCGSKFDPKTFETEIKKAEENTLVNELNNDSYEGKSYNCSQCGATLLTFDETAITFCSYCGSQAMLEDKMIKHNNPQYIIPFKKTKEECIKNYKKKLRFSLFAPSYMKSDIVVSKFRGIYIPYCVYKVSCHEKVYNNGKIYTGREGDYKCYDEYEIAAQIDSDVDGIAFDIVSALYDQFSHSIPHDFSGVEPFNVNYLSGFYADSVDVESSVYDDNAEKIVEETTSNYLYKYKEYGRYGCSFPKIPYKVSEKKTGMFPLYFLAVRNKKNTHINYAIVNGQTGKVAADIPVDFKKYILFTLIFSIPIFLFINNQLLVLPTETCIFSLVTAIFSLFVSAIQLYQVYARETHEDDEGYMSKKGNEIEKNKFRLKFKDIIKQLIAIILCVVVLIINPVWDYYYYGAAIITLFLVILSFYDLIKEHNLIVSSKLPHLEKRGGNGNEAK